MDGLALLCNLFADGPVTLKRLRAARVESLVELERAAPESLAAWLHASVPQARAFVEEARKLVRRLAETGSPNVPTHEAPAVASTHANVTRRELPGTSGSADLALQPGLLPGLDESACARLALHKVHTVQALSESAGLALARRTGIPYSTLLELSRRARRLLTVHGAGTLAPGPAEALAERELKPFVPRPRENSSRPVPDTIVVGPARKRELARTQTRPWFSLSQPESELARSDEFTLPDEPESAGPFG